MSRRSLHSMQPGPPGRRAARRFAWALLLPILVAMSFAAALAGPSGAEAQGLPDGFCSTDADIGVTTFRVVEHNGEWTRATYQCLRKWDMVNGRRVDRSGPGSRSMNVRYDNRDYYPTAGVPVDRPKPSFIREFTNDKSRCGRGYPTTAPGPCVALTYVRPADNAKGYVLESSTNPTQPKWTTAPTARNYDSNNRVVVYDGSCFREYRLDNGTWKRSDDYGANCNTAHVNACNRSQGEPLIGGVHKPTETSDIACSLPDWTPVDGYSAQPQAYSPVWSATLTVSRTSLEGAGILHTRFGCRNGTRVECTNTLTEDSTTTGGATYQVTEISRDAFDSMLRLRLDKAIPQDWALYVDGVAFRVADATVSPDGREASWTADDFSWPSTQGELQVSVRLAAATD